MPPVSDYDSAWKDALESYFPQFMALLWPDLHIQIDWHLPLVFLDKGLQALMRSSKRGRLRFTFPVVYLESWRSRMSELIEMAPDNPFAVVVLAQLEANATWPDQHRLVRKTDLVRRLCANGCLISS